MAELYVQHLDGNTTTRSLPQSAVMLSSVPSCNPLVSKGSELDPIGMLHQASSQSSEEAYSCSRHSLNFSTLFA